MSALIKAWIDKYILRRPSPSAYMQGYIYMWDLLRGDDDE